MSETGKIEKFLLRTGFCSEANRRNRLSTKGIVVLAGLAHAASICFMQSVYVAERKSIEEVPSDTTVTLEELECNSRNAGKFVEVRLPKRDTVKIKCPKPE